MKTEKHFISVGEPWDFTSPDGENIINGNIIKVITNNCLIFRANYILNFGQFTGDLFVLYPRNNESNFDDLQSETCSVTVNGNVLLGSLDDNASEFDLKQNSKFVLIGSLRS